MQQSADPLRIPAIRKHCYAALRVIKDIESRHGKGNLAENVTDCLNELRVDVKRALNRLDVASGGLKLLDYYSEFRRAFHTCKHCGWHGKGAAMKNGSYNTLGINKLCPQCGEHHSFVKFSVLVEDDHSDE